MTKRRLLFRKNKLTVAQKRHFLFFIFYCWLSISALAQQKIYENAFLYEIFDEIEKSSALKFNYDAELIASYIFSGSLDLSEPKQAISILLKNTPLIYQQNNNYILITLAPKQHYTICGYIKNKSTGAIVNAAFVYSKFSKQGTISDERGYFSLEFRGYKNEQISISFLGFKTYTFSVGDIDLFKCNTIELEENTYDLGLTPVVKGYLLRGITEGEAYGAIDLNYKKLIQNYSFQEQDVLKIVQLLPGVTSNDESAVNLSIRGGLPNQNLILWEGGTLYDAGHVFGLISAVNPFVVDHIHIYKSVYAPKYENRVGGVIDISLQEKITNQLKMGGGTTLTEAHSYFGLPLIKDKLATIISGRITTNKLGSTPTLTNYSKKIFETAIIGEEDKPSSVGFDNSSERLNFYDWNGKILYRPTTASLLQLSYFHSRNKFKYHTQAGENDLQSEEDVLFISQIVNAKLSVSWTSILATDFFANQSVYRSDQRSIFSNLAESGFSYKTFVLNNIDDFQLGVNNNLIVYPNLKVEFGCIFKRINTDYQLNKTSTNDVSLQNDKRSFGSFYNTVLSFSYQHNKVELTAGLRSTYYQKINRNFIAPRFYFQYKRTKRLKYKLSAGSFQQFITQITDIGQSTINTTRNLWVLTDNNDQRVLKAKKISIGMTYQPSGWLLDVEGYFHRNNNIINHFDSSLPIRGLGTSTLWGLDFLLKKEWKKYDLWLNYTLAKHHYLFPDYSSIPFAANNDIRNTLSVYNHFRLNKWNFTFTYHFKNGLPYSKPIQILPYTIDNDNTTYYRLAYDDINSHRLPHYHRFDLAVSYRNTFFKKKLHLETGISILNVFNKKQIANKDFFIGDIESSDNQKVVAIEKFNLNRTPQILVRIYW